MSAAEAVRRRFLEALPADEIWTSETDGRAARRAVTVDADEGTAVIRRTSHGDDDLVRVELPSTTSMEALPELLARGGEWFATGDHEKDAVASLLVALDEAVDREALDGASDLVLDEHGLFVRRCPSQPTPPAGRIDFSRKESRGCSC